MLLLSLLLASVAAAAVAKARPNQPRAADADAASWQSKIKNVVVLVEENRSFDEFVGGLSYSKDINGLVNRQYCNPM
jgi:phospholipase C